MNSSLKEGFINVRLLVVATLAFSYEYLIVRELKLNRLYRLKCRSCGLKEEEEQNNYDDDYHLDNDNNDDDELVDCNAIDSIEEQLIESNSRFPNIDKYLRVYYKFSLYYHGLLTVKYLILCLLQWDQLAHFRFLGCHLVGRFVMNGRVTGFTNYFALFASFYLFVWRVLMLCLRPQLKLYCFEFLMYNSNELKLYEAPKMTNWRSSLLHHHGQLINTEIFTLNKSIREPTVVDRKYLSILECKNSLATQDVKFERQLDRGGESSSWWWSSSSSVVVGVPTTSISGLCSVRLNRTSKQLRKLSKTLAIYWICWLLFISIAAPTITMMAFSVLLTSKGFQLSYHECYEWISAHQRNQENISSYYFSYILPHLIDNSTGGPKRQLESSRSEIILSFGDIFPLNLYHLARVSYDLFENLILYFDLATAFMSNSAVALLTCVDVCEYSKLLCSRLKELNNRLELQLLIQTNINTSRGRGRNFKLLQQRVENIQSMLMDYFKFIESYDKYASILAAYTIVVWLTYSAMVSNWILVPGTEKPKLEWYILHVYATVYVVLNMGSFGRVRVASRRLYPLIASLASRDLSNVGQRRRWLIILKFFSPKPMYCFRMLHSAELSWLFLLKLASWLLTALIVASSFFSIYSGRVVTQPPPQTQT